MKFGYLDLIESIHFRNIRLRIATPFRPILNFRVEVTSRTGCWNHLSSTEHAYIISKDTLGFSTFD